MTVSELIEALSHHDPSARVFVCEVPVEEVSESVAKCVESKWGWRWVLGTGEVKAVVLE